MVHIIFDLILILANIWVVFDKDAPNILKRFALLGVILLIIYTAMRVLSGDV